MSLDFFYHVEAIKCLHLWTCVRLSETTRRGTLIFFLSERLLCSQQKSYLAICYEIWPLWYCCQWEWGPFMEWQEKHFQGPMHGKLKCCGKIYWNQIQDCPQVPDVSLSISVEEAQSCHHQAPQKGQSPENLCHWFSPVQSLLPSASSSAPAPTALLYTVPRLTLGACLESIRMLGLHLELSLLLDPQDCYTDTSYWADSSYWVSERPLLGLDYSTLGLKRSQPLFNKFHNPLQACFVPSPKPIHFLDFPGFCVFIQSNYFPRLSSSPLGHHFGFYCTCLKVLLCHLVSTAHALMYPSATFPSTAHASVEGSPPPPS